MGGSELPGALPRRIHLVFTRLGLIIQRPSLAGLAAGAGRRRGNSRQMAGARVADQEAGRAIPSGVGEAASDVPARRAKS
jgi:hypothetical protein